MIYRTIISWFNFLNYRLDIKYFGRRYGTGAISIDQMPPDIAIAFRLREEIITEFQKRLSKYTGTKNSQKAQEAIKKEIEEALREMAEFHVNISDNEPSPQR